MKKHLFLLLSCSLVLSACDSMTGGKSGSNTSGSSHTGSGSNTSSSNAGSQSSREGYGVDNTGRNVRDRNDQSLTSGNQGENEMDRTITQKIRQAVMDDNSLSTNAKNIKIITLNGVVTLRGPVSNDREKNEIAKKARAVNGVKSVDNQIEVAQQGNDNAGGFGNTRSDAMRGDHDTSR